MLSFSHTNKVTLVVINDRMAGFEIDCNDGKGEPSACHHVGEFFSVIKVANFLICFCLEFIYFRI